MAGANDIFDVWVKLLTFDGEYDLCDREFAFKFPGFGAKRNKTHKTWIGAAKYVNWRLDMIFIETKYKSEEIIYKTPYVFNNTHELRRYCLYNNPNPISIDVGPIYFKWKKIYHAPLVFDFDIDAYNHIRMCKCNKGKTVCNDCWKEIMIPAMKELDDKLINIYQFKSVQMFFSGRRGIHVWVLDKRVWSYSDKQRAAIRKSIQLLLDTEITDRPHNHLVKLPLSLHPVTKRRSRPIDYNFLPEDKDASDKDILTKGIDILLTKIKDGREN